MSDAMAAAAEALNKGDYARVQRLCRQVLDDGKGVGSGGSGGSNGIYGSVGNEGNDRNRDKADAWFFLSIAAAAARRPSEALRLIDRALLIAQTNHSPLEGESEAQGRSPPRLRWGDRPAEYLSQKARYHIMLNQRDAAVAAANEAWALKPTRPLLLDTLGVVYSKAGLMMKAQQAFTDAVAAAPDNPQFLFNLASVEQFLGHEEAARLAYEKAVDLRPGFARAWWALSELEKNRFDADRLQSLQRLLGDGAASDAASRLSVADELYLCHAISRDYERRGDYGTAFAYLERGKRRRRQQTGYSPERDRRLMAALREAFSSDPESPIGKSFVPSFPRKRESSDNDYSDFPIGKMGENAIFVLGMPRSGTTLVERIIDAHSDVKSLGELQEFPRAIKRVSGIGGPAVLDAEVVRAAAKAAPAEIGATYMKALQSRLKALGSRKTASVYDAAVTDTAAHTAATKPRRFIDKMPLNFLCVGFILSALPKAKVVCLQRHPLDTILSNYRQLFALDFSYYDYHYSLTDTAAYYAEFLQLITFWQKLFGPRVYQISYEALVENPEQESRALFRYLELPWQEQVLNFHESEAPVTTASAMQVRQPLYRTAAGRWRKYQAQLQPAIDVLKARGIEY